MKSSKKRSFKKKQKPDKFTQLVDDFLSGEIGPTVHQIAFRAYIRRSPNIPDDIKGLLAGTSETHAGIVFKIFQLMGEIIGCMELAYRRGEQAGKEVKRRPKGKGTK